ncbi:Armadillo-type fold [Phytophthora cinnamomi]|uniref:Armadillo-type fold n=1 Tax=Phytophthora cinnamomi TaxID=4785 RepID=UPI003559B42E|nr:Armadillo-type fold [Phytophthora cinnamomi]
MDHDAMKSAIEGAAAAPKRKKSMIGRIKKKLSTKLGRRKSMAVASPTPQDLIKAEPEITEVADGQQQNEEDENNDESGDKRDSGPEQLSSETELEGSPDNDRMDSVLEFNASLPTIESIVEEIDEEYTSDTKHEYEQKGTSTPEQVDNESDVDDRAIEQGGPEEDGITESHNEAEETPRGTENHVENAPVGDGDSDQQTPNEEDDEDTLEVFEGNQSVHSSPRQPEEDDDEVDEECYSDKTDAFESSQPMHNVDLVIIGVTPMSLRNRGDASSSYERCEFQEEEEPLETEPDAVATPRLSEPLSSPLKRPLRKSALKMTDKGHHLTKAGSKRNMKSLEPMTSATMTIK